jgi:hypothetical protein
MDMNTLPPEILGIIILQFARMNMLDDVSCLALVSKAFRKEVHRTIKALHSMLYPGSDIVTYRRQLFDLHRNSLHDASVCIINRRPFLDAVSLHDLAKFLYYNYRSQRLHNAINTRDKELYFVVCEILDDDYRHVYPILASIAPELSQ